MRRPEREPFSGCCDNVWKAYDMICRPTAVLVAQVAGFPRQLASAYLRFHDAVEVRAALALGLGHPKRRQLTIPQGRSWSNTFFFFVWRCS